MARFLLDDHMPAARLAELRSVCTFAALAAAVAITAPGLFKIRRQDLRLFTMFGIIGLAGVNALYFAAIARLDIGVALTIQYLGPLLLLLYLKVIHRRKLPRGLWGAAGLAAIGCFFVVGAYHPAASTRSASPPRSAPRSRSPSTCSAASRRASDIRRRPRSCGGSASRACSG